MIRVNRFLPPPEDERPRGTEPVPKAVVVPVVAEVGAVAAVFKFPGLGSSVDLPFNVEDEGDLFRMGPLPCQTLRCC